MTYTKRTFEEFLQERCFKIFPQVLDDDMPDAYDKWTSSLDGEEYIEYADLYGKEQYIVGKEEILKIIIKNMKILKRIAEEAYCFTEITFDSLEEYEKGYPIFADAMKKMKRKLASTPAEKFNVDLDDTGEAVSKFRSQKPFKKVLNDPK
jgi:hypothetical protein